MLFKVESTRTGDPFSVPPLKLNVADVSAGDAFSVPPLRLNVVPAVSVGKPDVIVPPLKVKAPEFEIVRVADKDNVPADCVKVPPLLLKVTGSLMLTVP